MSRKHDGCCVHGIPFLTECSHCAAEAKARGGKIKRSRGKFRGPDPVLVGPVGPGPGQGFDGRRKDPAAGKADRAPKRHVVRETVLRAVRDWDDWRRLNGPALRVMDSSAPAGREGPSIEEARRYWRIRQVDMVLDLRARSSMFYYELLADLVSCVAVHGIESAVESFRSKPSGFIGMDVTARELAAVLSAIDRRIELREAYPELPEGVI